MSIDEAVAQFRLGRELFLVFVNASTEAVNVLYRRRDGSLGLVEPTA
jgi:putative sigma-54 modulation protein